MNFSNAVFEQSCGLATQLPECNVAEVCFLGRSNVGKSSLINKVLGRKNLAYTGSKPGKTVTINFYTVDGMRFVDMPGYGFAKVSDAEKERWAHLMDGYFSTGRDIGAAFQLIDMRRMPTDLDMQMIDCLEQFGYEYYIVLTKSDKLNTTERTKILDEYQKLLPGVEVIPFSALKGEGVERIREIVEKVGGNI